MEINRQPLRSLFNIKTSQLKNTRTQQEEDSKTPEKSAETTKTVKEKLIPSSDILKIMEGNASCDTEKFADVKAELDINVPDRTTTIEEKEKALSYIERLLKCDDITPELKNYWENKKDIIEMEIQNIKNEQKNGKNESINDVAKEWKEFTTKYWNKNPNFDNTADRVEYYRSYYNMYISFCDRALACDDISEEERTEWTRMKQNAISDLNYHNRDLNRYNTENGQPTEKFDKVFAEMKANVPDSTSTIQEKNLALSYIERMLSCDDIPNSQYWENKKSVIEMEIQLIKNEQQTGKDESIDSVANEWNEFTDKYWNKTPEFKNTAEITEYYRSYYNTYISFCNRMLACKDLPADVRQEWINMRMSAISDLNYHSRDLNEYNKKNGIKTESFNDVFEEFDRNVPDRTTTADEKYLAISYIERMLSCDDIPNNLKIYWQNKEAAIKKELEQF